MARLDGPRRGIAPGRNSDPARGITKGPNNVIYVVGSTLGPNSFAQLLILAYDATTGALVNTILYSSDNFTSEYGVSIVTDSLGNLYVLGATVGDGHRHYDAEVQFRRCPAMAQHLGWAGLRTVLQ